MNLLTSSMMQMMVNVSGMRDGKFLDQKFSFGPFPELRGLARE